MVVDAGPLTCAKLRKAQYAEELCVKENEGMR